MNTQLIPNKNITCERCKHEKADYECKFCRPINTFCNKCDLFIHSLPSKKNHKRDLIINLNKQGDPYNYSHKYNSEKIEMLEDQIANLVRRNFSCVHCTQCHNCNRSNLFTKEYIDELKNIFLKEKEQILFQNNSLQNNLDRIKTSFNDEFKILNKEKDLEIIELNRLVDKLKSINEEILKQLNMKTREYNELKFVNNNLNNEWEDRLKETKEIYEKKIKNLKNNMVEIEK
jgi:hypothetical protein